MQDQDYICNNEEIDITIVDHVYLAIIGIKNQELICAKFSIVILLHVLLYAMWLGIPYLNT